MLNEENFDVYNTILDEMRDRNMISHFIYEGLKDDASDIIQEVERRGRTSGTIKFARLGDNDDRIFRFYDVLVSEKEFERAWLNVTQWPLNTTQDADDFISRVLNMDPEVIASTKGEDRRHYRLEELNRLAKVISDYRIQNDENPRPLPTRTRRERYVYGDRGEERDQSMDRYRRDTSSRFSSRTSPDSRVRTGRYRPDTELEYRGTRDPRVERINSQEVIPGKFYVDMSRIPRNKFKVLKDTPDPFERQGLFGRKWKKTFVFGYQMSSSAGEMVYEVWYNSIDSTFSLHDIHANTVTGKRYETLQEATRAMFNAIVSQSSADSAYARQSPNFQSIMRSIGGGMDQHIKDLMRREEKEIENKKNDLNASLRAFRSRKAVTLFDQMFPDGMIDPDEKIGLARGYAQIIPMITDNRSLTNLQKDELIDAMTNYSTPSKYKKFVNNKIKKLGNGSKQSSRSNGSGRRDRTPSPAPSSTRERSRADETRPSEEIRTPVGETFYSVEANISMRDFIRQLDFDSSEDSREYNNAVRVMRGDGDISAYKFSVYSSGLAKQKIKNIFRDSVKNGKMKSREEFLSEKMRQYMGDIDRLQEDTITNFKRERNDNQEYVYPDKQTIEDYLSSLLSIVTDYMELVNEVMKKESDPVYDSVNLFLAAKEEFIQESKSDEQIILHEMFDGDEDLRREYEKQISNQHNIERVKDVRNAARTETKTQRAIVDAITNDLMSVYNETKFDNPSAYQKLWNWITSKIPFIGKLTTTGRSAPIESPQLKGSFKGSVYSASFVVGYNIRGGPDIEIWYITEPSEYSMTKGRRVISSFYLFDATAQKVIRSYIPYLRLAIQEVSKKIGFSNFGRMIG